MTAADPTSSADSASLSDASNLSDLAALLEEAAQLGVKTDDIQAQMKSLQQLNFRPQADLLAGLSLIVRWRRELEWALILHARLLLAEANYEEALLLATSRPRRLAISSQSTGCLVSLDYMVRHAANYDFIMGRTPLWFASARSYLAERNCPMAAVMVDAGSYFHLQETRLARLIVAGELVAD